MKDYPASAPRLGILATRSEGDPPWAERSFYRKLWLAGSKAGIGVIVFFPDQIDAAGGTVDGYRYDPAGKRWVPGRYPMPELIYDRRFSANGMRGALYRSGPSDPDGGGRARLMGSALGGKWATFRILCRDEALRPYLPNTAPVRDGAHVAAVLRRRGSLFLKPHGGSQGKGVLRLQYGPGTRVAVAGRDARNRPIELAFASLEACAGWLTAFLGRRRYVMQPYLALTTRDGIAFDVRVLMQKDGSGRWTRTGMAVRKGLPGSVTSNLHGGGSAEAAGPFLEREFGTATASAVLDQIADLSDRLPIVLEHHLGRLFELGLDFGVDRQGRVWILEVNSKPGRAVFAKIHDDRAKLRSVFNPIHYARYLLDRQHRRVT